MVIFVGVPYLYLTSMELSVKDLAKDSRASLTMSLKQECGIIFTILEYRYCIKDFVNPLTVMVARVKDWTRTKKRC